MTKSAERNLVIGLDVGTSKVIATVGEITADNKLSIVGVGTQISRGMDKGGVNDLNLVSESIRRAIDEAELMADCRISSVYLGISGKHIQCQNESGVVAINNTEVTDEDIENVIHIARSVPISAERKMLHALPQEYSIDMQEGIKNPLGMSGVWKHVLTLLRAQTIWQKISKNVYSVVGLKLTSLFLLHLPHVTRY